jgi:hypothetical protein
MATVKVFDPAMCCSTGVCGTDVDPTLSTFAADLEWLTAQGVDVERATLSQEPAKFVATEPVRNALETDGTDALPAIVVDGVLTSRGRYPARAELAMGAGVKTAPLQMASASLPMASAPAAGGCCGGSGGC